MSGLRTGLRRIAGLFIDDPLLAAGAAGWIALIAILGVAIPAPGFALARALALALGLCVVLTVSIVRDPARPS